MTLSDISSGFSNLCEKLSNMIFHTPIFSEEWFIGIGIAIAVVFVCFAIFGDS